MIRAVVVSLPFILGLVAVAQLPPPVEQAGQGKVQCYSPNREKKTCLSIAAYRATAKGGFENLASVLLAPEPVVVMNTISPVTMRDGQVCGPVRKADLDTATFTVNGAAADSAMTAKLRQLAAQQFGPMLDRDICTAYIPKGGVLETKVTVDGAPMAGMVQQVIWVSPGDGYKVAP